ncbi:hypothetical protein ES703_63810 [subsurface metagenome]
MEAQTIEKLKQMLNVPISKVEEQGEELVVYVPKEQIARAIGASGSVIRSVELILQRKITIKEST